MDSPARQRLNFILGQCILWGVFILGLWVVVIRPLGPGLSLIAGDLGDVRFNNYILEHFYRWVSGLEKSYWSAPIFYPFSYATAFSDNLLGSAPFYLLLRWLGFDRESAYQGWYLLGFALNYAAAVWVLQRLKLHPLAVAAGAFYFSFGLPVLAQTNHPQLIARFAIPLACFCLWQFAQTPRLPTLLALAASLVLQFYLGMYNGLFLLLLLAALFCLIPCFTLDLGWRERALFWPLRIARGWQAASAAVRLLNSALLAGLGALLALLLWPYFQVTKIYGFTRDWTTISGMLPRWRSYLIADGSLLWHNFSARISGIPVRDEQQLFPGVALVAILALFALLVWRMDRQKRAQVWLYAGALAALFVLTLYLKSKSPYGLIYALPGLNSIRAVSRIILVMMFPLSVLVAFGLDALLSAKNRLRWWGWGTALLLLALLAVEPATFQNVTFSKAAAQARLVELRKQIPAVLPQDPILMLNSIPGQPTWATEIDAMLLSQELGWPTFNGYSGNFPIGYSPVDHCAQLPQRILSYMSFMRLGGEQTYFGLIRRAVPLGFDDCDPVWWQIMPSFSANSGPLPPETFARLALSVDSLTLAPRGVRARLVMTNQSTTLIAARSSTGNPVRLSWRWVSLDPARPVPGFDIRKSLDLDLRPGEPASTYLLSNSLPAEGQYRLEVSAIQVGVGWFHERGMPPAISRQVLRIDANGGVSVEDAPNP